MEILTSAHILEDNMRAIVIRGTEKDAEKMTLTMMGGYYSSGEWAEFDAGQWVIYLTTSLYYDIRGYADRIGDKYRLCNKLTKIINN